MYFKCSIVVQTKGLEYRHTDNINFFLLALKKIGLPKVCVCTCSVGLLYVLSCSL